MDVVTTTLRGLLQGLARQPFLLLVTVDADGRSGYAVGLPVVQLGDLVDPHLGRRDWSAERFKVYKFIYYFFSVLFKFCK